MLAKLKIKNNANPKFKFEKEFGLDKIGIGQDPDHNDVHLPGPAVSRKHAVITRRGDGFALTDFSKNGTHLNGNRLKDDKPHDLKSGDRIAVLDYLIEFEIISASVDTTELLNDNPFHQEAQKLAEAFVRIYEKYARAELASRDDFLRRALQEAFGHAPDNPARAIIVKVLQNGKPDSRPDNDPAREKTEGLGTRLDLAFEDDNRTGSTVEPENPPSKKQVRIDQSFAGFGSMVFEPEPAPESSVASSSPPAKASNRVDRLNLTVDVLLASTVKMIADRRGFRLKFLEETMMGKRKKNGPLDVYDCTWEELKEYLHDEMILGKEADQRLAQLQRALNDVIEHQLSLLTGYWRSVGEGSKKLLSALSPAALEAEGGGGILPIIAQANLWKFYQNKHGAITNEISRNFGDFERMYFREALMVGYKNKRFD